MPLILQKIVNVCIVNDFITINDFLRLFALLILKKTVKDCAANDFFNLKKYLSALCVVNTKMDH